MTKDHKHRSKAGHGYHGDMPPQHHHATPEASAVVQQAEQQRKSAIVFLNRSIGGEWRWNNEEHKFSAEFNPQVAEGLQNFMNPYKVIFDKNPLAKTNQTRLALTPADYATVRNCVPFIHGANPVAKDFLRLLQSSERESRGRG